MLIMWKHGIASLTVLGTLLLGIVLMLPGRALAKISGEVEVSYDDYHIKDSHSDIAKSALFQRYTILYDKKGRLGKFGNYGFNLGYEWGALNVSQSDKGEDSNSSIKKGHLLYGAEYAYNSRTLPLNISLFSRDLTRISNSGVSINSLDSINGINIIPTVTTPELQGGTKITSGAKIVFGEMSSDSLASKFPRLVELPKIILDYRENYVSNLNSAAPEHSRTRLLNAGIAKNSLWLTYKMLDTKDYLSKSDTLGLFYSLGQNTQEQSFRLGTVDIVGERIWVELTNWIRISADGVMTKTYDPASKTNSLTDYTLNLFASAKRDNWDARSFNSLSRKLDGNNQLEEELKIPLYVSGSWGTDTSWQARFEQKDHRISNSGFGSKEQSSLASFRVETLKRSLFTLTPTVSVELYNTDITRKLALHGSIETSSTRRFSDKLALNASYTIKSFSEETSNNNSKQLTQTLVGKAIYRINNLLVFSADQNLTINLGAITATQGAVSSSEKFSDFGSRVSGRTDSVTNDYYRSVTNAKIAWSPGERLRTDAQATVDVYGVKGGDLDSIMTLTGSINYSLPQYAVGANTRYSRRTIGSISGDELAVTGFAQVAPSPYASSTLKGTYTRINEFGNLKNTSDISQRFTYMVPSKRFRGTLFEVTQQSAFLQSSESPIYANLYTTARQFSLQGKYFFNSNLYAAALSRYSLLSPGNVSEWMGGASIGVQYKLLQGNVEYYQGKRTGNDNRTERRFSANLKKQF
ncbi:hypothetical protein KI809_03805 [Geobacter pelophilus]|uniref:Uncharacterized protein n=1 Tax=Geoanaerobacter pelophilus TaxID=60036 RepID=A0AAW4KXZ6_9BACT|nr:hypothetical protein [Geoanaerobacter pelophilus]MBT0663418.1 hypothetical protein [Geoanaerobacter pelophilus]